MANQIVQRLIAAGASPDRAQAFANQFAAKKQEEMKTKATRNAAKPTTGKTPPKVRPKDIEDAFDKELAALSAANWPMTYRPPLVGDPSYQQYVSLVLGNRATNIKNAVYQNEAPDYTRTVSSLQGIGDYNSLTTPEQKIVWRIASGEPYSKIYSDLIADTSVAGVFNEAQIGDMINKFINQRNKAEETTLKAFDAEMNNDPYYKVGLPDPKLKYGETTDLTKGIIDVKTHPVVSKNLGPMAPKLPIPAEEFTPYGPSIEASKASASMRTPGGWLKQLESKGQTPFEDEVYRREYLRNPKRTTIYNK